MSQKMTDITLTPYEFWKHVKNDEDCNEILERLGDHNELVSHFLFFSSLARMIDELDDLAKKKKKEIGHVFMEMTHLPNFQHLTVPLIRRKHCLHPYWRSPVLPQPQLSSLHDEITIPILSLPPSPILLGDSQSLPIDIDSLPSSSSASTSYETVLTHPPTRPTTPVPPFGIAHCSYCDGICYFIHDGVYHVQEELSGHIYEEGKYYSLPRPPYRYQC
jgi:hypothetical protein